MSNTPTPPSPDHLDDAKPEAAEHQASVDQQPDEAAVNTSSDAVSGGTAQDVPEPGMSELSSSASDALDENPSELDTDAPDESTLDASALDIGAADAAVTDGVDRVDITATEGPTGDNTELTNDAPDIEEAMTEEGVSEEAIAADITVDTTPEATAVKSPGTTDANANEFVVAEPSDSAEDSAGSLEVPATKPSPDAAPDGVPSASPSVPSPGSSSPSRAPSGESEGTAQKVLGTARVVVRSATIWTLQTTVRGFDWVSRTLEARSKPAEETAEPVRPQGAVEAIWVAISPLLVKGILFVSGVLNVAAKWGLRRLGAEIPSGSGQGKPSRFSAIMSSIWTRILPILKQIWRLWQRLLAILRKKVLPNPLKSQSDLTLTVLVGGILVSIFWLTSAIAPDRPAVPTAQKMPEKTAPTVSNTESARPPAPDQRRLEVIQEKLEAVADDFGEDIVQSVQIDGGGDRLAVMLGTDWYRLDAKKQDNLVRNLFERSQNLSFDNFDNLDILDFEGHRVARSPVIGKTMIIFERTSEVVAEMDRIAAEKAAAAAAEEATKAVLEESPTGNGSTANGTPTEKTSLNNEVTSDSGSGT